MSELPELKLPEFESFTRIPRLSRECLVSEKIDGTNALVYITDNGAIYAGSRNRWITPQDDNAGFAAWVEANKAELMNLGPGRHHGEWWGAGIQRRYGLKEKRFSLFNTSVWADPAVRPACCHVVPVLYQGLFTTDAVEQALAKLAAEGSVAAPGFMQPEGVVVYHIAAGKYFKKTLGSDGHKGARA